MRRLAWFLATCPDEKFRDSARAIVLAQKAASIRPHEGVFWYTLGICLYRSGEFGEAQKACQRGSEMRELPYSPIEEPRIVVDRDRYAGYVLAMSLWQLGNKDKARAVYDATAAWMNEHAPNDEQLKRFSVEAQDLFGLTAEQSTASGSSETQ